MTEKRFTVPENYRCIQDNLTKEYYMCEDKTEAINLTYLLNALHEENEQLKQEIENGIESFKRIQRCHTLTLVEENEQLKNNIKEAYENERTQIGKNVLKQLIEQIEE